MVRQLRPPLQVVQHLQLGIRRNSVDKDWKLDKCAAGTDKDKEKDRDRADWDRELAIEKKEERGLARKAEWDFDLGALGAKSLDLGEKLGEKIPGYRYSAAFITTLRQNLALSSSLVPDSPTYPSPMASPLPPTSSPMLPPSSTSLTTTSHDSDLASPEDRLASLPSLTTTFATEREDQIPALKLIADSIAQQRQLASYHVLTHNYAISLYVLLIALGYRFLYTGWSSLPLIFTTSTGLVMGILLLVRWLVGDYLILAEKIGFKWLDDDEILITTHGTDIIGALVFRMEREGTGKRKKTKGLVRAWTVRRRERARGIGRGLLEEFVKICAERGAEGCAFVDLHANSGVVLPAWLGSGFESGNQERAAKCLAEVEKEGRLGGRRRTR